MQRLGKRSVTAASHDPVSWRFQVRTPERAAGYRGGLEQGDRRHVEGVVRRSRPGQSLSLSSRRLRRPLRWFERVALSRPRSRAPAGFPRWCVPSVLMVRASPAFADSSRLRRFCAGSRLLGTPLR